VSAGALLLRANAEASFDRAVVAIGNGEMTLKESGRVSFVFTEVFTFTGDRINRLETFHINIGGSDERLFTID
jgi:hypothetical protein